MFLTLIKLILKEGVFFSGALGVYYLFLFALYEKIPFPFQITALPAILVALGLLCLIITIIFVVYSLISAVVISDPLKISYYDIFYVRPTWIRNRWVASVINFVLFFCVTPSVLFVSAVYECRWTNEITLSSLVIMPFLFSYYALTPNISLIGSNREEFKRFLEPRFWKTALTFFYIGLFSIASFYVFIKYMEFGWSIKENWQAIAAIVVFLAMNYLVMIPPKKKDAFQKIAREGSNKLYFSDIAKTPAFWVYVFAVSISLFPFVASKISIASLRILNMGGGMERKYYYTPKARITIPPELVKECVGDNYCITKDVKVILDLGDVLFIKGSYFGNKNTVISLPGKYLYEISIEKNYSKRAYNTCKPSKVNKQR